MNTVHYRDLGRCVVGESAHVVPVDHPIRHLNGQWATTTRVRAIERTSNGPIFATTNTLYVPCDTDETPMTYKERAEA